MNYKIQSLLLFGLILLFTITSCQNQSSNKIDQNLTNQQIVDIATKAYVYGYPLVLMKYTERVGINVKEPNSKGAAPINQIGHMRQFPDHTFTDVVKPNVDTYYSIAWMDLKSEPLVLTVPKTERYYLLPLLDAYTNVFSVPGTRTTGTDAHNFLLTGPNWKGEIQSGMEQIACPTNMVWMIGRTQVNGSEDGKQVVWPFQDGLKLIPLSQFGKEYKAPEGVVNEEDKKIVPVNDVKALSINDFFNKMTELMADNPPSDKDQQMVKDMASIGIIPGEEFDINAFDPEVQKELNMIPGKLNEAGNTAAQKGNPDVVKNGWIYLTKGMGSYGIIYGMRAFIAYFGLGANLPEDAVYPSTNVDSEGNPLDGSGKYIIHFAKGNLPPVNAFWSLTAYDKRDLLVENPINRYSIGDRDKLTFNKDGSLDIYIQNTTPGKDKESNWLPSPKEGKLNLTLRLYWPKKEALDYSWMPPAVQKVK